MARVKFSALITSINGSSGGTTFQRNAYGSTIKNKPNMPIPRSTFQNDQKIILARITASWRSLTLVQQQSWVNYANTYPMPARLNPDSYLNGFNYFVKYNCIRTLQTGGVLALVSQTQFLLQVGDFSLTTVGGGVRLSFDIQDMSGAWILLVFMSPSIQSFTNPRTNKTRLVFTSIIDVNYTPADLNPSFIQRFGEALGAGKSYYLDITFLSANSGQIFEVPTLVLSVP